MMHMNIEELSNRAQEIADKYRELNKKNGSRDWAASDYMAGFVGDVGDLSKLLMAKEGLREKDDVDTKIAHELADCLWSILVIANKLGVDIEKEFTNTMNQLEIRIKSEVK